MKLGYVNNMIVSKLCSSEMFKKYLINASTKQNSLYSTSVLRTNKSWGSFQILTKQQKWHLFPTNCKMRSISCNLVDGNLWCVKRNLIKINGFINNRNCTKCLQTFISLSFKRLLRQIVTKLLTQHNIDGKES